MNISRMMLLTALGCAVQWVDATDRNVLAARPQDAPSTIIPSVTVESDGNVERGNLAPVFLDDLQDEAGLSSASDKLLPDPVVGGGMIGHSQQLSTGCSSCTHNLPRTCGELDAATSPWNYWDGLEIGGWGQLGYHSQNGGMRFNNHADRFNLHQGWIYLEDKIDTRCGFDFGGRLDYVYGVDAQNTQSFGLNNDHWDNDWDNGIYGHALPQAYVETGYGDLSIKIGHFFTQIGYESVAAPQNFFYSHAYTMNNSEPFTHTGAMATYHAADDVTVFGGYTMGWDSGFEDNGDSFLGGLSYVLNDCTTLTYMTTMGRFSEDAGVNRRSDERGYMQSVVLDHQLSQRLNYVFQTDYLRTTDAGGNLVRDTRGINQYLIYQLNPCLSAGARLEWWNFSEGSDGFYGQNFNAVALAAVSDATGRSDVYSLTYGLNYMPYTDVLIRPEIRCDFVREDAAFLNAADITFNERNRRSQATFGIDAILVF